MRAIEHLLLLRLLSSAFADGKIFDLKKSLKSFNLIQLNCWSWLSEAWNWMKKKLQWIFFSWKKWQILETFFWSNRWNNCCFQENNFLMWNLFFCSKDKKKSTTSICLISFDSFVLVLFSLNPTRTCSEGHSVRSPT